MGEKKTPELLMRRAIELSRRGFTAPNPHVGCVIVQGDEIVGEGFHDHAGGPHAEVVALGVAGDRARGADIYVTLEPCSHQGRTGPCSEALIRAGVASVTYAVADPNPRAQGGGARLSSAGIRVESGLLRDEAAAANSVFLTAMNLQRPYVVVKAACSLDGKIALKNGQSQWITGPQAREQGHRLRADLGAVLVGANTVRKDNPKLSARIDGVVNQPRRIVLDPKGSLGKDYEVFKSNPPGLRVVGEGLAAGENDLAVSVQSGVLDLHEMIRALWDRGLTSLLVEGGGITIGHFFEAGLVDRLEMFVAPIVIGDGLPWISGVEHSSLEQAFGMTIEDTRMIGPDLWITSTSNRAT